MNKTILYAKNTNDLISLLKNNQGSEIVGGCTIIEELPAKAVSTYNIPELCQITRHERYIDVGPGCTLSSILDIGQNHLPPILYEALKSIANPIIRNMATIGGNICYKGNKLTLFAPLMALEAKLEFKNSSETKYESIRNFKQVPQDFADYIVERDYVMAALRTMKEMDADQADWKRMVEAFIASKKEQSGD